MFFCNFQIKVNLISIICFAGCNPKPKNNEGNPSKNLAKDAGNKEAAKECRKAEKSFGKVLKNGEPWVIQLYDWSLARKIKLMELFKKYDPDDTGTIPKDDFIETMMDLKAPVDQGNLAKIVALYDKNKESKIDYSDYFNGKKYVNKNFLMSAFEGKKKKKKGGKKGKKKGKFKLVVPICIQDEGPRTYGGGPPAMFIPQHIHFTDTRRFDRDTPPKHPLQDDSAWYLQQPDKTYMNINEAAKMGDFDSLKNAFAKGVSVDTRDKYYKTPLMVACASGHINMAKFLVDNGWVRRFLLMNI